MKYESPEIELVELDSVDIIQTSGLGENETDRLPFTKMTTASELENTSIY